jgi:formylglycine-generating enzyme required for sulfatase activity
MALADEFHYASNMHPVATSESIVGTRLNRDALVAWYRHNRARSRAIFDLLVDEAYYAQPIALRHPIVFYEGHLPAFSFNTLVKRALGGDRDTIPFGWDNEFAFTSADVEAFSIERHDVTNAAFLAFVEAGGYESPRWWTPDDWAWVQHERVRHPLFWEREGSDWYWRGMFDLIPLPLAWPAYVSQAEASAYARWRGARLPTEAEFQRAAFGAPDRQERRHPWGDAEPSARHGVFDFSSWDPEPAGSHPAGASAWGVEDLVGNGWEWTSTVFAPYAGFRAMGSYPEYSTDFFDGEHFVMKGASPATARELIRPSFRNWFRARYPYVYATFRCVKEAR